MNKALVFRAWARFLVIVLVAFAATLAFAQGLGSLAGNVYRDDNANGARDLGEPPLAGAALLVAGPSGVFTPVSSPSGAFSVPELAPGTYTVIAPPTMGTAVLVGGAPTGTFYVDVAPGPPAQLDIGYHEKCVKFLKEPKILWLLNSQGVPTGAASITITYQNDAPYPIGWIGVNLPPGVTMIPAGSNPIQLNTPIPPGGTGTFTFNVTGLQPNSVACIDFTFHSPDLVDCCAERLCIKVPECDCYQVLNQVVECLPNGNFLVNMQIQNLTPFNITQIWTVGQPGSTVTPIIHPVAIGPGGIANLTYTISGNSLGGTNYCVRIMFYNGGTQCCVKNYYFDLPDCKLCEDRPAICYATRPVYNASSQPGMPSYNGPDWSLLNGKSVSAVTCYSATQAGYVFGYMNHDQYQCAPPPFGNDPNYNPRGFHNGMDSNPSAVPADAQWIKKYMGNVFALTFDNQGNIYVAQTSCYNADYAPSIVDFNSPGTPGRNHVASPNEIADRRLHGRIFKIANGTGKVTIFNEDTTTQWNGLPSGPDPAIVSLPLNFSRPEIQMSGQNYPEVGDITFDYDNNQMFATSLDDGKIYRYNMSGTKLNAFDPWTPDTGATHGDGFADWGENIWAIKYHRGRLYFSRWVEDFDKPSAAGRNEIWSIAIDPTTDNFIPSSLRFEVAPPDLGSGYGGLSPVANAPISDITFQNERVPDAVGGTREIGMMVLAERGMGGNWGPFGPAYEEMAYHAAPVNPTNPKDAFTNTYPHRARGLKYACDPVTGNWALCTGQGGALFFQLGTILGGTNSAGGVDFDFDDRGCTGPGLGNRTWFMADAMAGGLWYGLQGLPLTGGSPGNSVVIDLNGITGTTDKSLNGDVEIPCREGQTSGRLNLPHFSGSCVGIPVRATLVNANLTVTGDGILDNHGNFTISTSVPDGGYQAYISTRGHLVKRVMAVMMNGSANVGVVNLIPGDINGDNEIGAADFSLLAAHYDAAAGDPNFLEAADLNWDGEIGAADFSILAANYGMEGDSP